MRHVNAGVTCQSCHGQVNNMPQVFQYASLNMGWCVSCHVNGYSPAEGVKAAGYEPDKATLDLPRKKATYDCSNCHY
jgi:mono/diheme cytochrome c family protein